MAVADVVAVLAVCVCDGGTLPRVEVGTWAGRVLGVRSDRVGMSAKRGRVGVVLVVTRCRCIVAVMAAHTTRSGMAAHTTRSGMAAHDSGPALWITCHVHPEDGRRCYTLKMASVVGGDLV